jgi:hypothetical protein
VEFFRDRFRRRYGWSSFARRLRKEIRYNREVGFKKNNKNLARQKAPTIIIDAISLSLELHVDATASRINCNALLCGGNSDYHAGLI